VTEIQVIAGDLRWEAEMNELVVIQGVEHVSIYVYCTLAAPVRGI
jgi:hypothetical protein